MCVLAAGGGGGVGLQDVQTHMHACVRRASSWHRILIFMNGIISPAASQQNVSHLGAGKPFVWVVKQRSVYLGLLDWQCPLSKRCFSCQHLNKWELICISLIPPLLLAPLEEFYFLSPPPPLLWIPSLVHATLLSESKFIKRRHFPWSPDLL